MKKTTFIIAILFGLSISTYAQNGGLFGYGEKAEEESNFIAWYSFYQNEEIDNSLFGLLRSNPLPGLPNHGESDNQDAPLGGGALLLIGFGAAYALKKRRK